MRYRTPVFIVSVEDRKALVVVPAWDNVNGLIVPLAEIPFAVWPGKKCFAQVNLGAIYIQDVTFSDWEEA